MPVSDFWMAVILVSLLVLFFVLLKALSKMSIYILEEKKEELWSEMTPEEKEEVRKKTRPTSYAEKAIFYWDVLEGK